MSINCSTCSLFMGTIFKMKRLQSKPDHALIQMRDVFQAELTVQILKVSFMHTLVIMESLY